MGTTKNKRIIFFVTFLLLITSTGVALADGGVVPRRPSKVYLPDQKAVISWDGEVETLILSTKIKLDGLDDVSWIIPIPSLEKPEVTEGDINIFYDLDDLFSPKQDSGALSLGPMVKQEDAGVEVIEVKKVDIYDITILKATDEMALINWLKANGYTVSSSTAPILRDYSAKKNMYFVANKINLANKYEYLNITAQDQECASQVLELSESWGEEVSTRLIYDVVDMFPECEDDDGDLFEKVEVLVDLERGVATPLKITFNPEAPFFPQRLSSINEGSTNIDLYFFSNTPVKDSSQVLSTESTIENKESFSDKYGLDQKYITYLTFQGRVSSLDKDSWFGSTGYQLSDPNFGFAPESSKTLLLLMVALIAIGAWVSLVRKPRK